MKLKINIAILQHQESINIQLHGSYNLYDQNDNLIQTFANQEIILKLQDSIIPKCDWYHKIDTFYDAEDIEKYRTKYRYQNKKIRIIKTGKEFIENDFNNFEYWVLETAKKKHFALSSHIPTNLKPIIKKEGSSTFIINNKKYNNKISLRAISPNATFTVKDVKVGVEFHWEHTENLTYTGDIIIKTSLLGKLNLINNIDIEQYLASVNSSEMRKDNNPEMLKAQTIAARSTVLATAGKHHYGEGFDLCNDDHCQCYQGLNRINQTSIDIAKKTQGEVLFFENKIVDARYSKICGGITERFSTCWEDQDFVYLQSYPDTKNNKTISFHEPYSEEDSKKLIDNNDLDCFCNTKKYSLPASLEFCKDNFRWSETISLSKLNIILKERFPEENIGEIVDFKILKRGPSGRIYKLEVQGTKNSLILSKELQVRRFFSDTHLRSSLIYFEKIHQNSKLVELKIKGAGWGHGVGLCQIGAEIMGQQGYKYKAICSHYYRGSKIKKLY